MAGVQPLLIWKYNVSSLSSGIILLCLHICIFPTFDLETLIHLSTGGYQSLLFLPIRIYWQLLRHTGATDKKRFRYFVGCLVPCAKMLQPLSCAGGQAAGASLSPLPTELSSLEGNLEEDSYLRWPDIILCNLFSQSCWILTCTSEALTVLFI